MNDDLISRQAAIDAINEAFKHVFAWDGTSPLGEKVLEKVPSVTPAPEKCYNVNPETNKLINIERKYGGNRYE